MLENFKNLLETVIPYPLMIFQIDIEKNWKLEVMNNACSSLEYIKLNTDENKFKAISSQIKESIYIINNDCSPSVTYRDPEFLERFLASIMKSQKEKQNEIFFIENIDEGKKAYFLMRGFPIEWEMKNSVLIILENITVYKELDDYKDKLLATVSHDLRTPLNGSLAMMELAIEAETKEKAKKYIKLAIKSSKGLLMLVNDLLDFSQFINGKLRLVFENINLRSLVKDVIKLIKFQAERKKLEFILEYNVDHSTSISTDPNRLKQILFNLLGNALKFTQQGHIKLTISQVEEIGEE
jgi:signal transduction histidine kinase